MGLAGKLQSKEPQQIDIEEAIEATQPKAKKPRAGGRSVGKSKDPDFHKLTVYIPMKTRRAVAVKIANEGGGLELSVLVTKLLDGWTVGRLDG